MKWYTYIICSILILLGVFFSFKYYQQFNKSSYENGSIDISNEFELEYFNYYSDDIVFYPPDIYDSSNIYRYSNNLAKCPTFNGDEKNYNVLLNGLQLNDCQFSLGSVKTTLYYEFYDIDGSTLTNVQLELCVNFYSDRTELHMSVVGSSNAQYMQQYFYDNGFNLKIVELL